MRHLKILFTLVTIAFLIAITSCKKESKTTEVKATVIDETTGARLAGATVFLQRENPDCFSCQAGTISMFTADANGMVTFDFEHQREFIYSLTASHTGNYWDIFTRVTLTKGEKNTKTLPLTPKAYIRVFIKNVNPYDGDDKIGLNLGGGGGFLLWNDCRYIYCEGYFR